MARYLIGIDEVGRGSLAGPITVGAMATKGKLNFLRGIKDSKKLSAKQREKWFSKIKEKQLKHRNFEVALASVRASTIDKIGISAAARLAVGRCLKKLAIRRKPHAIILDGSLYAPRTYLNQTTIIKGDEKIPIIAAASIIAKVTRDRKMVRLAKKYPKYWFDLHKGYGTILHARLLRKFGRSPVHRRSFRTPAGPHT
ncbi:MAG: hypothetical protein A3C07_04285 [Candidatus Sungbacteria bacterium RIFCSPHIGHO2_02_FULL_47_11]|uniref:Ribonuclease HII n=1 Tax=Candidatus Sungbacteria bacterium RIFCSPHIGHO2_02_FULL_47_11 TaxID=1802270 RepID=A0A1G2KLN9_9BACT|nr:MAG: hypothetical protein A3C07_04285 [Candidatus Sungbacteria bacterium RIFCSPHIGHO2_02_FULL_47_11]